jgi:hypothetical protein
MLSTITVENYAHFLRNISSLRAKCLIAQRGMPVVHRVFHKASTRIVENMRVIPTTIGAAREVF